MYTLTAGCGGAGTKGPEGPKEAEAAGAAAQKSADAAKKAAAPVANLAAEVLGTVTIASIDDILAQGTTLVRPQLPPAFQAMANPQVLKAQMFAALKAPELEAVLDTTRPLGLAVADPKKYEGKGLGPVVVAVPVKDPNGLIDFMAKKAKGHETTAAKVHKFTMDQAAVYMLVHGGTYALLAGNEGLLAGAGKVMGPLVEGKPGHLAHMRIDMEAIYKKFGKEIDEGIAKLEKEMGEGPMAKANTGNKMISRWMGYVKGMRVVDVAVGIKGNDVISETALTAISGSEFAKYMTTLNAGAPWGLKYVPAESGIAAVARDNPETMLRDLDEALETLTGVLTQWVPAETIKGWRGAMMESIKYYAGAGAGGMYATADGGIGFASATKLKDGKAAKLSTRKWMKFLASEVEKLINKSFRKEIDKVAKGAGLKIKVLKDKVRAGGAKGDLFQVKIKWPKLKDKKDREMMDKVKKGMVKLIGRDLNMAFVVVGDVGLMTFGKDYKKRMGQLVAIAKGKKPGSTLVKKLAPYTDGRDVFMVFYSPLETLAEQALRVADKVGKIPPDVRDVMAKVMPGPNTEVPMTFVASQKGETVTFEGSVSANLVGMIARGAMHAMSRKQAAGRP